MKDEKKIASMTSPNPHYIIKGSLYQMYNFLKENRLCLIDMYNFLWKTPYKYHNNFVFHMYSL